VKTARFRKRSITFSLIRGIKKTNTNIGGLLGNRKEKGSIREEREKMCG
jgi:hypothetical protein